MVTDVHCTVPLKSKLPETYLISWATRIASHATPSRSVQRELHSARIIEPEVFGINFSFFISCSFRNQQNMNHFD